MATYICKKRLINLQNNYVLYVSVHVCMWGRLCCPAVVRVFCDTNQTCWGTWELCCSSQPFWVEPLSRNKFWTWSSFQTTQTTRWVLHYCDVSSCVSSSILLKSTYCFFFPSAVHPVYHCCHWDSVQQGADLLFTSLHSCSFQWSKVRVTHHPLLVTDKKWLLDFSSFRFRGCLWYTQPQYSALLDLHRYII